MKEIEMYAHKLRELGATLEKKEDRFGDTKSGWWLDDVWLAPKNDPKQALRETEGHG
jgi:hypothetical protein